jgi:hypothetical protein
MPCCLPPTPFLTQDPNVGAIGVQVDAPGAANFKNIEECAIAGDYDQFCAGVTVKMTVDRTDIGTTCKFIRGSTEPGQGRRTVTRAELSRIAFPSSYL